MKKINKINEKNKKSEYEKNKRKFQKFGNSFCVTIPSYYIDLMIGEKKMNIEFFDFKTDENGVITLVPILKKNGGKNI